MEEMNPDGEGRLSPRDFGWWLADEGTANVFPKSTAEGFACDSAGETPTVAENSQADASQGDRSVRKGLWGDQLEGQGHVASECTTSDFEWQQGCSEGIFLGIVEKRSREVMDFTLHRRRRGFLSCYIFNRGGGGECQA